MSSELCIFAERRADAVWQLAHEPEPETFEPSIAWRPRPWLELHGRHPLVTFLTGQVRRPTGLDHTGIQAIDTPRGLPADASEILRAWATYRVENQVAFYLSWASADELLAFDRFAPTILHRGYIAESMAHHFVADDPEARFPFDAWPGGDYDVASSPHAIEWLIREHGASEESIISTWPRPGSVEVHWAESHADVLGDLDELWSGLVELGPPEDVRLVFWVEH